MSISSVIQQIKSLRRSYIKIKAFKATVILHSWGEH